MSGTLTVNLDDPSTWGPLTPSTQRLHDLLGTNPTTRRLTPSEIELLLQSKRELAALAFATTTRASTHKVAAAA